ncbi:MAG TPA: PRC-barrel domain-containing protein [Vicinamibacterales bacterium]|jgi:hypothetical protein|nr:PRC-barrel domain-containing protein [Vicinamibacterales bacterium]
MDHPRPWLRIIDAGDLDDADIDFGSVQVTNAAREKLGTVDGFVVDVDSGRPFYVVVDAGGWFKSKHYLLPVGHAQLDRARKAIVTDLERDRVNRFPGFDKHEFRAMSDEDVRQLGDETSRICGVADITVAVWDRPTYRRPDWWQSGYYRGGEPRSAAASDPRTASRAPAPAGYADRPQSGSHSPVVAHGGETSPHPGGRAQPGDVLGVETGGERTYIGDTKDSENDRRRDAEKEDARRRK